MSEKNQEKESKEKKGFLSKIIDKFDKKLEEKSKLQSCCCCSKDKDNKKSCC
ncbi:hypothetical protein KA977_13645 [Candidatus Dependentiae bacterium]|nr:hypothetical protein [Candidatus Dependentiae bacterium]